MILKLSDLKSIAIYSSIIPKYKGMGFITDVRLTKMGSDSVEEIEYNIGDKLKELTKKYNDLVDPIKKPIQKELDEKLETLSDEEKKVATDLANVELNKGMLSIADQIQVIEKENIDLWLQKIDSIIKPIEIEEKDYDTKLAGEPKTVNLFDRDFTFDGYDCLLRLIDKGIIVIKEQPTEKSE